MKGQTGGSLGGRTIESARRRKRRARARRRQEAEWAAKSGPVIVRVGEREIYVKSDRVKQDLKAARELLLGQGVEVEEVSSDGGPSVPDATRGAIA